MSELINNQRKRIDELKELLLRLQSAEDIAHTKYTVISKLKKIPYEDVLIAEQELIADGVPIEKMLELCDLHSFALEGVITPNTKPLDEFHPVSILKKENLAFKREIEMLNVLFGKCLKTPDNKAAESCVNKMHGHFNNLMDIEKHFTRKEQLIFPFLEKYGITGPSTVMWGKDDQIRKKLKDAAAVFATTAGVLAEDLNKYIEEVFAPALASIEDMIMKEEDILFPMSIDTLTDSDWYDVFRQSGEIGYSLIDVKGEWRPSGIEADDSFKTESGKFILPSGSFSLDEIISLFNTLPFDLTFVDKDDTVRFFTEGSERIFQRSRAIIGRKVQFCHPPHSVQIVETILNDFKSGKQNKADFWINMRGQFIYISYFAMRGANNEYLGTLEVSQNLTELRKLEGEKRILSYGIDEKATSAEENVVEKAETNTTNIIIYDAREDLENGIHPVEKVMSALSELKQGERYRLITPFTPTPLIEKAKAKGFSTETKTINPAEFHTEFFAQ